MGRAIIACHCAIVPRFISAIRSDIPEDGSESQCRGDRQLRIPRLATPGGAWLSVSGCDSFIGHPDREAAALPRRRIYSDTLALAWNVVPSRRMEFEGHDRCLGSDGGRLPLPSPAVDANGDRSVQRGAASRTPTASAAP